MPRFLELLQSSWEIYKQKPLLYASLVLIMLAGPLSFSFLGENFLVLNQPFQFSVWQWALIISGVILGFLISFWANLALIYVLAKRQAVPAPGFGAGLKATLGLIGPYIWLPILLGLALLGALVPLILPLIILWIGFSLAVYVLVIEKRRGLEALLRSRHLIAGHWEAVFWRVFVLGVLTTLLYWVVGAVFASLGAVQEIAASLIALLLSLAIVPVVVGFMVLIYEYLASKRLAESFKISPSLFRRYRWLTLWGVAVIILMLMVLSAGAWLFFQQGLVY
jgi:hypothetical protein